MARKLILKVMLSPGDICTLTAAIESLHSTYPGEYITDVRTACDEIFAQLNRLLTYKAGMIKSDLSDIAPNWTLDATRWTLDSTGNQTAVDYLSSYGSNAFSWYNWFQNTANTVNEYTARKSRGGSKGALSDTFSSNTTANYSSPGSSVTFTVSTSSQTLTVNTIGRDTIDGYLGPQAQALILTGEPIGPTLPGVTFTLPGTATSGQAGLVFGYKSGAEYWLYARDMNGTANIYHVQNGVSTQVASTSYPAPVAGVATGAGYAGGWSFSEYAPGYSFGSDGFPSGQIGFYTTVAGTTFTAFSSYECAPVRLSGRWLNDSHFGTNTTAGNGLTLPAGNITNYRLILLENLRLQKFQATFAVTRASGATRSWMGLVFNAADRGNYDYVAINHDSTPNNPIGYATTPTTYPTAAPAPTNCPRRRDRQRRQLQASSGVMLLRTPVMTRGKLRSLVIRLRGWGRSSIGRRIRSCST